MFEFTKFVELNLSLAYEIQGSLRVLVYHGRALIKQKKRQGFCKIL